jgi:hypothetical protein
MKSSKTTECKQLSASWSRLCGKKPKLYLTLNGTRAAGSSPLLNDLPTRPMIEVMESSAGKKTGRNQRSPSYKASLATHCRLR